MLQTRQKYKTWNNTITEVEVLKETEHSIWKLDGRRRAKRSEYENYFDTKPEAKQFLTDLAQRKVDDLLLRLDHAKGRLGNVKGIKV